MPIRKKRRDCALRRRPVPLWHRTGGKSC